MDCTSSGERQQSVSRSRVRRNAGICELDVRRVEAPVPANAATSWHFDSHLEQTFTRSSPPGSRPATFREELTYWGGLPLRWGRQVVRNSHDILRVLDLIRLRPLPAGLVPLDHPWVTGIDPESGDFIWRRNVIFRTPRSERLAEAPDDDVVLLANGRFLAHRVHQSAVVPELPQGLRRRMPHAINYMHGASHYNSGLILLNDLQEGYRLFSDSRFRRDLWRFVRTEQREVLTLFRDREYRPRDLADFSCMMRSVFPWFCNPNGPQQSVLWGNFGPFPAANLITGQWAQDVYALRRPGGTAAVVRPAIDTTKYFTESDYGTDQTGPRWPERLLARANDLRVRIRGEKGRLFFVDRRAVYADQIRRKRGVERHSLDTGNGRHLIETDPVRSVVNATGSTAGGGP